MGEVTGVLYGCNSNVLVAAGVGGGGLARRAPRLAPRVGEWGGQGSEGRWVVLLPVAPAAPAGGRTTGGGGTRGRPASGRPWTLGRSARSVCRPCAGRRRRRRSPVTVHRTARVGGAALYFVEVGSGTKTVGPAGQISAPSDTSYRTMP